MNLIGRYNSIPTEIDKMSPKYIYGKKIGEEYLRQFGKRARWRPEFTV